MDKLFSGKILVGFCAVFIVVWCLLQTVSSMRLEEEAEIIGTKIFSWEWPDKSWRSRAEMTQASILRKTQNDAVIKVSGKQQIRVGKQGESLDNSAPAAQTVECSAVLTLYNKSGKWVLGRVEL